MNFQFSGVFLTLFAAAACFTIVNGQSWSMGNGNVTYQIQFTKWQNAEGKTWKGSLCDSVAMDKCDTRFIVHVEPVTCNQVETGKYNAKKIGWPGPAETRTWKIVGKNKYEENSLTDFALLNLTGIVGRNFCKAILRCQVVDVDPLSNDAIDDIILILPGLQEINLPRFEYDARYGLPVQGESIFTFLANHTRASEANLDAIQQHVLEVRVRAWGIDATLGRHFSQTGRDISSLHAGYDYATPYKRPTSGGAYNTSSGSSSYPRQSSVSSTGSGSYNSSSGRYYPDTGNNQIYSRVSGDNNNQRASSSASNTNNRDDMYQRRMSQSSQN